MSKEKSIKTYRLCNFVVELGESVFPTDNFILFCKICNVKVASENVLVSSKHNRWQL